MRISLIFPRDKKQVHGMWPPLGIIALGTLLRDLGHDVRCHDTSFDPSPERVIGEIGRFKPEVVGVSCLTDFVPRARVFAKAARQGGAVTVAGGPHPTIDPAGLLSGDDGFDYAVMGEGEKTLPALVDIISGGSSAAGLKGVAFREGGEIIDNGPPEPIEDLDAFPMADRDLLDVNGQYLRARAINMHASRGCPFRCKFCQPTLKRMFGARVRFNGPDRVAEEIETYGKKYSVNDFFFHDDTFTFKKSWLGALVEKLGERDLVKDYRYVVNSRVDTFDEERAQMLKAMGVYYVLFGIETGAQSILDSIDKGTTIEQAREAFRICRKYGFRTHAYILLGSPSETRETLRATENFVKELKPNTVHVSIYTPLLGTYLADECEREGKITLKGYSDFDYYLKKTSSGDPPIKIPGLTYQDLLDSRARILGDRKWMVMADNARELIHDLTRDPSLDKLIFRYQFYKRMKHYFG